MKDKILYGKQLVQSELIRRGYTIYSSEQETKAFDFIVYNKTTEEFFAVICLVKPRRQIYDTGMDLTLYNSLKAIENVNHLKVFCMFVDSLEQKIYGQWLSELEIPAFGYPLRERIQKTGRYVIYFDLNKMKAFKFLSEEEIKLL